MQLYNSLTKKIEEFSSHNAKKITLYVCGITPYDTTHLGHAFTYISFDLLVRYFTFLGYKVSYTQNVTDINDRDNDLLKKAQEKNLTWQALGDFWTNQFLTDMKTLNWTMPTNYIKASESISWMIDLIQKLLTNGIAYQVQDSVYLDITKKSDFGKLSGLSEKEMLTKAKEFEEDIENIDKKHPLDITLWRAAKGTDPNHIPFFKSPFGNGRPGWHIECSAMAISTLGEQIDIHGGGKDLIYPHHESEIAQSEGATQKAPFAKFWMHTGTVGYKGEKMSKSLGNIVMVKDLLKTYSSNAIRFLLLSHHYREDWEFSEEALKIAEKKIHTFMEKTEQKPLEENFLNLLENDLDSKTLFEKLEKTHTISKKSLQLLGFVL